MLRQISSSFIAPWAASCVSKEHRRHAGTAVGSSKLGMKGFSDLTFNTSADAFLEYLETAVETMDADALEDISLSDGVLTIDTTKGSFVLNKQAPNVQLWLSSPISGPHHYDMHAASLGDDAACGQHAAIHNVRWHSDRDHHCLQQKLSDELSSVLGKPLQWVSSE
mmetsp:Transcript_984/g.1070  ORF Transcript_984/g.1070 Transcript_984/m.1070 type:complete len:166 (-) Transcript_984:176-673(-)